MKHVSTIVALVGIVLVVGASLFVGARFQEEGEEQYGGTDALVTEMLEEDGAEPWFDPLLELESGELESGLFAFQAALGGIVLGYCVGRLHERRRRDASPQVSPTGVPTS